MCDIGLQVTKALFRTLAVDRQWSHPIERGFRWWAGPLAQQVWAEPCFEAEGQHIARIHIRTDFLANIPATPQALGQLGLLMRFAGFSGLLYHPDQPGRYQLASSLYVNEPSREWWTHVTSLVASCQVAEAHVMAEESARLLGGRPDYTNHPSAGPRQTLAPVTETLRAVAAEGGRPSLYRGEDMLAALDMLAGSTYQATGGEDRLVVEFPFGTQTSLLVADGTEANPRVGNGLLMRLTLPLGAVATDDPTGTQAALGLNRRELTGPSHAHFLGSWCPTEQGLTFVSFFPNAMAAFRPGCVGALVQGAMDRACWAAEAFGQSFDPEQAQVGQAAMLERLRGTSEEDLRQIAAHLPSGQDPQEFLQVALDMKRSIE
jgi:hypothetical protein